VEPTSLVPVLDGVQRWSVWNEPRKLWFNGHVLRIGSVVIAIDPVPMTDEVERALAVDPPALCIVTNRDHRRATREVAARFGARILVPRADADALDLPHDELIGDGSVIAGELRAIAVADAKSPGELVLHWADRRLLVLGDAAVGRPAGALGMLPDEKFADVAAARAAVAALAALAVDTVLVGDGDDILLGGSAALAALARGPARAPAAGAPGC
jgi:glyoxylase-like metal-dependent hydrolase (beta-lactamase superfamily II)